MKYLISAVAVLVSISVSAQFYSQGTNNFSVIANWNTDPGGAGSNPILSDFTDGSASFIIQDGDVITIASDIDIASIEVGQGVSGTLTFGDGTTTARTAAIGSVLIQAGGTINVDAAAATHNLNISSNYENDGGTLTLSSGSGSINFNFSKIVSTPIGGNWNQTSTWIAGVLPTAGDDVIIDNGATVTLNTDVDLTTGSIQVGQGGSSASTFTFGDGTATARNFATRNFTIQSNGTAQPDPASATHTLNISGDYVNNGGTVDLNNTSGVVNTTFSNTVTSVISGSGTNDFNNLTISGGGNIINTVAFTVVGGFSVGNGVSVSSNGTGVIFQGDFTLTGNASYTTTASTTTFNGASAQAINIATGSAEFNNILYDNSTKTITANSTSNIGIFTNGGTIEIADDAIIADGAAGAIHTMYNLEVKNQNGIDLSASTVNFMGGEIRSGDGTGDDGTIDFGIGAGVVDTETNDVNIVIVTGNTFVERDDQLVVDGDITVQTPAQLIINGIGTATATEQDSRIIADATLPLEDTHDLTIEQNGDLYMRGEDNFPTTFTNYSFAPNSIVRYDAGFNQTIRGQNSVGTVISFARVLLSGDGFTKTLFAGEDLTLTDILNINGGATFSTASTVDITIAGSIFTGGANATFSAAPATLILNGTENQTLDVFDGTGFYLVQNLTITNPDNQSRRVNINDDIVFNFASGSSAFTATNTGGNSANVLIVDIASNSIVGRSTFVGTDAFTLSEYASLFVSGSNFFNAFDGGTDIATINSESAVRFEGGSDQVIPTFAGANYGNIEFSGNGDKYLSDATLSIAGDVSDLGGAFEFNLDEQGPGNPITSFITVGGDWNMSQANVGINDNGTTATVTFNGADQLISASDFENVVFAGTGTKTIQGGQIVTGDLSITTSGTTTVTTSSNVDISGNWSEAANTVFQQDGGTTTFLGGVLQTISTQSSSYFNDLDVELIGTTLQLASTSIRANRDFDLVNPATLDLDGADDAVRSLRVGRNALFDNGSTLSFANTAASIILDGDIAQNFDNEYNSGETYPTLQFDGAGEKDLIDQNFVIVGDFIVETGTTVNGNNEAIDFSGANWTVNGNFLHVNTVTFSRVGTTTVSSSNFNNVVIGDGVSATVIQLSGNINLENNLTINDASTLDASVGNHNIQLEADWNGYGTYLPGTGTVTFIGNASQIRTDDDTSSVLDDEPQATAKAFYNLRVNNAAGQDVIMEDDEIQDGILTVLNDFTVESGNFRFQEDAGGNIGASTLRVGADFIFSGGTLEYASGDINTIELNGTLAATHFIDLGGNVVREFQITGSDTYELTNTFEIQDDVDDEFVLSGTGTLDLNGQIMIINRGGFVQSDGVVEVDAGASLVLDGQAVDPDYDKSGGDFDLVGSTANPATLTALDASGFNFTQTAGDFEARNYTVARTTGDGITISGGTIHSGGSNGLSNGNFTNGGGTAYLTLQNIALGSIQADSVTFNVGPTFNVSANPPGTLSGFVTFVIAGGTLSGSANEDDDGTDGGGFVRWQNDPGFTWSATAASSDWATPANWTITGTVADDNGDGIPNESTDIVYIQSSTNDPIIDASEDFNIARLTITSGGSLTLNSGELDVDGNVTVFGGADLTLTNATDSLKIAGSLANAGNFVQNTGKLTFDGPSGTHSINSDDNFNNINFNGGADAIYTLGSNLTVTDSISVTGGTFDASSGFTFNVEGGWLVSGGTFNPGVGTVRFNGASAQFISGGTLNNGTFLNAGQKNIVGNISFAGDVNINDGSGNVVAEDGSSILVFVGDDWNNNNTTAGTSSFTANDGSVVINGEGGQNIGGSQPTTFNNISFQGLNAKNINTSITVNGDMSITAPTVNLTLGTTVTGTGGGTFNMSGGILDVEDMDNFPSDFGTVNLSGGLVRYFYADFDQDVRGGITYNNIELLSNGGADVITRTLLGDITVNGTLTLGTGDVTFEAGPYTVTITGDNAAGTNHFVVGGDDIVTWTTGTLIHSGTNEWDIDADLSGSTFNNMTFSGGRKDMLGALNVNGNMDIGADVIFDQNANAITNDGVGTDAFSIGSNASYFNDVVLGTSLPSNFDTYTVSSTSLVTLNAAGDQTLFTNGGTVSYGAMTINSDANVTLDGNVTIEGDFDMNDQPTLVDGGFDITFNGSTVDIHDYTPTSTVTFSGADQNILDNDGAADNLLFNNVVFSGTGTKTLNPNGADEVQVNGTMTIDPGVSVTTADQFRFQGTTITNNGSFSVTDAGDPLIFDGATVTWDPGINDIAALTLENTSTVSLINTSLNIGNGDITVGDGSTLDFGSNLSHNIASDDFFLNTTGVLAFGAEGSETTIVFDRTGTQRIPFIDAANNAAQITNIPNLTFSGTGTKLLTGTLQVNDITLESTITSLDIDATNEYSIEVRGNWDNQGTNFVEREGIVTFYSNIAGADTRTITTNDDNFAELIIDGVGTSDRTYTLVGDLTIEGEGSRRPGGIGTFEDALTLTQGTLDVNGNTLTLGNNDGGDPTPERSTVGANGSLIINDDATLSFSTDDDGGDNGENLDAAAVLDVSGQFHVDGSPGSPATVTRSSGGDRITITIQSGATIEADNYSFSFLADEGLQVLDGALFAREDGVGTETTFSNGSFNNINTNAGPNTYLVIEADLTGPVNIENVTFNFDGTPTQGNHFNVERSEDGGANNVITFSSTSGNLGSNGGLYENDGDTGDPQPDALTGRLIWPLPSQTNWQGDVSSDWTNASNWDAGVPSPTLEAVIPLGNPFNPTLDLNTTGDITISGLTITDGILRIQDSDGATADTLTVDGNLLVSANGTLITTSDADLKVSGSFELANNATYDNGGITISLTGPTTTTPLFSTGTESVGAVLITGDADYQINGTSINVDGNFTVSGMASLNPLDNGYTFNIGGDVSLLSTTAYNTAVDGDIVLNGTTQSVTNLDADGLILAGSGVKTLNTVTVNDIFTINSGVTGTGAGPITWENDVIIDGTFNGASAVEYTFNGEDWIAGQGSYGNAEGTVIFNNAGGNTYIRQSSNAATDSVEFHNVILRGSANVNLGRFISGAQEDGNVRMSGDMTVENTIGELRVNTYLIRNTTGAGTTFTLQAGERIEVDGADNFPKDFGVYAIDPTSTVAYEASFDQIVRGGFAYGNLTLNNNSTSSLSASVDIDGDLFVLAGSTLDVTSNNYTIRIAGRWDTEAGLTDGSFLAQSGTVIFDGAADQIASIGNTGTQTFNIFQLDKSAGIVDLQNSDITINEDLNIEDGQLDINSLDVTIGGNLDITGTGVISSNADGTLLFNATSGSPTIRTNGSNYAGNVTINAPGRTYTMLDNMIVDNVLTITDGTLEVNGNTLEAGNTEDVINIFGTLNVSTEANPGGTLALGNQTQLIVQPGGTLNIVGTSGSNATVTRRTTGSYGFTVSGTGGNPGNIAARFYLFEFMDSNGIYIDENGAIDVTNNFSDGTFLNGLAGGVYLRIENSQAFLDGSGESIRNVVFNDNPGGGAVNVAKTVGSSGVIEFSNYTGVFAGEEFDSDPNNLIVWLDPSEILWTGTVSTDWFNVNNWSTLAVPTGTDDVVIPSSPTQATLNPPTIGDNTAAAEAANLTVEAGNSLTINTSTSNAELIVNGTLTLETSSTFQSIGANDTIRLGGSLILNGSPTFSPGTGSTVFFSAESGLVTMNTSATFNNFIMDVDGQLNLLTNLNVGRNFIVTDTSGVLSLNGNNVVVGGDFDNRNPSGSVIDVGTNSITLTPAVTGPLTFDPGEVEYYNVTVGDGTSIQYDLTGNLNLSNNFTLNASTTLDLIGTSVSVGDSNADVENASISGSVTVGPGESFNLGSGTALIINAGGNFQLSGASGNLAALSRKGSSGNYTVDVLNSGEFGADFYDISFTGGDGIDFASGSTLTFVPRASSGVDVDGDANDDNLGFRNGNFSNGAGNAYLTLANSFGFIMDSLKSDNVSFGAGPINNVSRTGSLDVIVFVDPSGPLQGPAFEDDTPDGSATTGNIRWFYNNPLYTWTGAVDTDFTDDGNWTTVAPTTTGPGAGNTVIIPDVGANPYPVIAADVTIASLQIDANAEATISDLITLTVSGNFVNSGTLTIVDAGNLIVEGTITNNGTISAGTGSTITISSTGDISFNGGGTFYNLVIDADVNTSVISTQGPTDVDGDFTITQGVFTIADASHDLNVAGNFTIDETSGGSFVPGSGTVFLDGSGAQQIDNTAGSSIALNNLTLSGGSTKTLLDNTTINGALVLNDNSTTLELGSTTLTLNGDVTFNNASTLSSSTSTVQFAGTSTQDITSGGAAPDVTFNNVVINNTNTGNDDVRLGANVFVSGITNYVEGIVASSSSFPMRFNDGATVQYDGVNEVIPGGIATDGNSFVSGPSVKIGDDAFVFPIGDGTRIARLAISDLTNGGSATSAVTDQFSAQYFFGRSPDFNDPIAALQEIVRVSGLEYWDLSRANGASEPEVTLYWDAVSEVNDTTELSVAHNVANEWFDERSLTFTGDVTTGTVTSNNVTSFSPFTLASTSESLNPLPVELLSFTGTAADNKVTLEWATATELNNDFFEVQRSRDGVEFEAIGTVDGNGTTSQVMSYSFVDGSPGQGDNFYRLRQVDFDGTEELHKVIKVVNDFYQAGINASVYPNPTRASNLNVQIATGDDFNPITVRVIDLTGQVLHVEVLDASLTIDHKLDLNGELRSGLYFVLIEQGANLSKKKLVIE